MNNNLILENAHIWARNFEGREAKFNEKGNRNFCVTIDKNMVEDLRSQDWNIRETRPNEEYNEPMYYIPVKVKFGKFPPKIVLITRKGKTQLDENTCKILDTAEIAKIDLSIRPYHYENIGGRSGVAAYLKTAYVTLAEDEFAAKYDMDDSLPDTAEDSSTEDIPW